MKTWAFIAIAAVFALGFVSALAITDHADALTTCLQAGNLIGLILGQYFGNHFIDTDLPGDRIGSLPVVTGE